MIMIMNLYSAKSIGSLGQEMAKKELVKVGKSVKIGILKKSQGKLKS